jgi:hypothetical protein
MRFRTRWLGYGPDDDTQQSYASLKNNLVFHKYCREQTSPSSSDAFKDVTFDPE